MKKIMKNSVIENIQGFSRMGFGVFVLVLSSFAEVHVSNGLASAVGALGT